MSLAPSISVNKPLSKTVLTLKSFTQPATARIRN